MKLSALALGSSIIAQSVVLKAKAATWRKLNLGTSVKGIYTWGANGAGILGDNSEVNRSIPVRVCGGSDAISISMGASHALALLPSGSVIAWGCGSSGQIGNNTTNSYSTPVAVCGISSAIAIAANSNSSYALLSDGSIKAWGAGYLGALGNNSTVDRSTPVAVCGISSATAIGGAFARLSNGSLATWGQNSNAELGDGTTANRSTPVQVCGITNAIAISNGQIQRYAVLANGTIKSWGQNTNGTAGNGTFGNCISIPVTVCTITNALAVYSGCSHAIALLRNGCMMSWGTSGHGRGGDNTDSADKSTPTFVCGISTAVAIGGHTDGGAALLSDGSLRTWGNAVNGALGNANENHSKSIPVAVCMISAAYASVAKSKHSPLRTSILSKSNGYSYAFIHLG